METKCCICNKDFDAKDDCTFICSPCQSAIFCPCGADDVVMDWGVVETGYAWNIECSCGNSEQSRIHPLGEIDAVAKEFYAEWQNQQLEKAARESGITAEEDTARAKAHQAGDGLA